MPEDDEQKENTIMGGIFGVASKSSCILDLFFGIDYHSHLGTAEAEWQCMIRNVVLTA